MAHALVTHRDEFKQFTNLLGKPETVNQIPVSKTTFIPCRAMDINQSSMDGQGEIIDNLCRQANIGDPTDYPDVEDIWEHVCLFHGDLRTGELIDGIQCSRSIETKLSASICEVRTRALPPDDGLCRCDMADVHRT